MIDIVSKTIKSKEDFLIARVDALSKEVERLQKLLHKTRIKACREGVK